MATYIIKKRLIKRVGMVSLFIVALFTLPSDRVSHAEDPPVKIGVLAKRGTERCLQKWSSTAEYLTSNIPGRKFVVVPLGFEEIYPSVEKGEVDFILANSSIYVELEAWNGANRIATLINLRLRGKSECTVFGGVVFCKSDCNDIKHLTDVKGKSFMAANKTSFGGWRMAWREFKEKGIDPFRDFKDLKFGGTHDAVVYAVINGEVDAGTVRTDTLERMAMEGKIDIKALRVINKRNEQNAKFPFVHSTRLYPEWPFAKLNHTPDKLTEKVVMALMGMPKDSAAAKAARCAGWTIPLSYQPAHECLKELRIGPYKDIGKITIADVFRKYWYFISITAFLIIVMAGSICFILRLNRGIKESHVKLQKEVKERKQAEEALIKTEARYSTLFESVPVGLYRTTMEGEILYANPALVQLLGYPDLKDLKGVNTKSIVHPEDRSRIYALLEREGVTDDFELRVCKYDGTATYVRDRAKAVRDANDRIRYFEGSLEDITERKMAEDSLKKSEEKYRTLVESSTDAVLIMDNERDIAHCNRACLDLFGYRKEEIEGKSIRIIHRSDESFRSFGETAYPMIEKDGYFRTEWEFMRKDGTVFPVETVTSPIRSSDETIQGYIAVIRDIREHKQAEQELEMAKEFAEAANRAKSEFLANMSHEIRTPMNGILGFADLLLEEELSEDQREAVNTIKNSGETLLNLINDILDLSKVESSKMDLETIPFNVENLALDIGESMRTNLGEKPIEINCQIGDIHTNLLGDPTRLRQIITNLIGNAIKFTEEGEIVIGVATEKEDDKQTTFKFSVRDTGIGIPEDKLETIFESFKQADGSTTREYGGTGLGLTISKKLSQLMGGDMWVESPADCRFSIDDCLLKQNSKDKNNSQSSIVNRQSKSGPGSIFYFTAIFNKDPDESEEIHPVDVSQLEGMPILIVDDNETALKIMADIVKRVGMVPVLAGSGEEALEYFQLPIADCRFENTQEQIGDTSGVESSIANRKSQIDVAIIDIMMPGMSGHELAGKISELTGGKTKMIALSSNVALGSAAETQKSGFAGFIAKPVRRQVLIDLIRTILGIGEKQPKDIVTRHRVKEIMTHDVRILYAEDNPVNQLLGKKMFKRMGYDKMEIAPDGLEAVKKVKENGPYDIIFMDIQMPNMDGMEATKEIRKLEMSLVTGHLSLVKEKTNDKCQMSNDGSVATRLPIIALTANAMKGDREKFLAAGMDEYLSKPFKREDIQRVIRDWVHKPGATIEGEDEKRILIVEDEEKVRKSIIRLLKREMPAAKVMTAEDGIDASAKLGSFMPELILADIRMPRMDGVEFIRYIRNTDRYAKTKIVAITGLHKDDSRVSAVKEAGVEKVVYKPWEDEDLILSIREALRA